MNKTEIEKLEAEISTLIRKLYRKVITYYRARGMSLVKDEKLGIQMYGTAVFGIAANEDGSFRKVCSLTIKNSEGEYPDLVNETKFKQSDWDPNKENIDE